MNTDPIVNLDSEDFIILDVVVEEKKKKETFHGITVLSNGKIYLSKSLAENTLGLSELSNSDYRLILVKVKGDNSTLYLLTKTYDIQWRDKPKEGRELKFVTKCFNTVGKDYLEYIKDTNSDIKYQLSLPTTARIKIPVSKTPTGILNDNKIFLLLSKAYQVIEKKVKK